MKFMTKLETIIMNRTGCNREVANLVANDILAEVDKTDEQSAEIERLNKEVDRLSQLVLYNDGVMVDIIKEFSQRARDQLRTGNMLMDKSISDIVYHIEDEMLEELK